VGWTLLTLVKIPVLESAVAHIVMQIHFACIITTEWNVCHEDRVEKNGECARANKKGFWH